MVIDNTDKFHTLENINMQSTQNWIKFRIIEVKRLFLRYQL